MNKKIRIYTTNSCAYCVMVKRWLESKGHTWEEVNIEENPDRVNEAFEISGQLAVPVTTVMDMNREDDAPDVIVGYNLAKLSAALAA